MKVGVGLTKKEREETLWGAFYYSKLYFNKDYLKHTQNPPTLQILLLFLVIHDTGQFKSFLNSLLLLTLLLFFLLSAQNHLSAPLLLPCAILRVTNYFCIHLLLCSSSSSISQFHACLPPSLHLRSNVPFLSDAEAETLSLLPAVFLLYLTMSYLLKITRGNGKWEEGEGIGLLSSFFVVVPVRISSIATDDWLPIPAHSFLWHPRIYTKNLLLHESTSCIL